MALADSLQQSKGKDLSVETEKKTSLGKDKTPCLSFLIGKRRKLGLGNVL
jgi:hypothetical protein